MEQAKIMFLLYQIAVVTFASAVSAIGLTDDDGSVWPNGTYGLIKAATGCPGGGVWQEGARTFDTEDTDAHNYFSDNVWNVLAGTYDANDITTEFCMKLTNDTEETAPVWPRGTFCILSAGTCPEGFRNGSIYWDGDDWNNHNSASGVLPSGEYSWNTRIDFCCRNDGRPDVHIGLPTSKPFVLFRYGHQCQSVEGMKLTETFVRWDDEDFWNSDSDFGAHPFDDGGKRDHKLHFCHYSTGTSPIG